MPPRLTPPPKGSYYPPNDAATYRDLLLFEERLKTNAASLQERKGRYQLFLLQLLLLIAFLLSEVLLQTTFLAIPYRFALLRALPEIYGEEDRLAEVKLHPYFASGLLFVSVTTLVLFFASGMYSEKIGYANQYVPHANRALRSFNMYLNVRQPPLRSKLPGLLGKLGNPIRFFFPRPAPSPPPSALKSIRSSTPSPSPPLLRIRTRSEPSPLTPVLINDPDSPITQAPVHVNTDSNPMPIAPIPPTNNPRGELIFSSRVHAGFRESYERYRTAFERKREEREREAACKTWRGWIKWKIWELLGGVTISGAGAGQGVGGRTGSLRGRGPGTASVGGTPAGSRRGSPAPGPGHKRTASSRSGTPLEMRKSLVL